MADLPPTQYMIMEVLAARARLGEPFWTLPKSLRPDLDALAGAGLVEVFGSPAPGSVHVQLTDAGRRHSLNQDYVPPPNRISDLEAAEQLIAAGCTVFGPGQLYLRHVVNEGNTLRVIPVRLHNALCAARVATPQGTTPEVLHCALCGFCYPLYDDPALALDVCPHGSVGGKRCGPCTSDRVFANPEPGDTSGT